MQTCHFGGKVCFLFTCNAILFHLPPFASNKTKQNKTNKIPKKDRVREKKEREREGMCVYFDAGACRDLRFS